MSDRFIVLSGCSGGGKSTLLEELRQRGHAVVEEPGRRIVQEELAAGGDALPWRDLAAFARRAIAMALADGERMHDHDGLVFFDRGLIDAASALEATCGEPVMAALATQHRYNSKVYRPGRKSMPKSRSAGTVSMPRFANMRASKRPTRRSATKRLSCRRRRWVRARISCSPGWQADQRAAM